MSSILVVERDARYLEPIREALTSGGWRVRLVTTADQAIHAAATDAPEVVLLSLEVPGADTIASSFSRSAGGPGVIGLLPERLGETPIVAVEADEMIQKPFASGELLNAVRRVQAQRRQQAPAPTPMATGDQQRLTSRDIFGDVLAEVETEGARRSPVVSPAASVVSSPRPSASTASDEALQRKLEKTLSGVLGPDPRKAPAPAPATPPLRRADPSSADIEALLSKTLSNLDLSKTGTRPAAAHPQPPSPSSPAPAPPRAAPPALVQPPAQPPTPLSSATVRMDIPDFARAPVPSTPPPAAPPVAPTSAPPVAASAPTPATAPAVPPAAPARKTDSHSMLGDLDLTDIENLARTGRSSAPRPAPVAPSAPPLSAPSQPIPPVAIASAIAAVPPVQPTGASVAPAPPQAAATQRIPVWSAHEAEAGDSPGSSFGQYTLLEKIAVGGMAEVWKARSRGVEGFQKTVAIKKILPHMTDNAEFVGMFIDEAKLAAQLNHPNIVHIYDLGKIGRDYYIAMEYVDGKDLRSLLNAAQPKRLRMSPGLAAFIAARLASALEYAHRKRDFDAKEMGLVHRDVSPQNVLLTHEGDVKLCDFGIAKAVSKASQTMAGALKGKLQYMSPEQAWGRPVDGRSDIFSLGSVLFEMLTGERLFAGDSEFSILESVRQGKVRTPRQVDPSLPAELDEITARALAADPDHRFQSAGDMVHHLEGFLAHLSPSVGPTDLTTFIERALAPAPASPYEAPSAAPSIVSWSTPEPTPVPIPERTATASSGPSMPAVVPLTEVESSLRDGGKKNKGLLWGGIAALVALGVLAYFLLNARAGAKPPAVTGPGAIAPNAAPAPAATSDAAAGLTSEALPGQAPPAQPGVNIEGMVNQALAKREQELRQQQEESLRKLQQQLSASKTGGAPTAVPSAAPPPVQTAPEPSVAPPPTPEPVVERPEPKPEPPPPVRQAETAPAPEPEAPRTRVGDLVSAGPGVASPQLVSAPNPEYPAMARNLKVEGIVVVSVLVDENGKVEDVRVAEPIRQNVGLNEAALRAARGARYRPATKEGVRVKMWTRLRVPFKL